ncbi:hypothetical protein HDV00_006336 [Rhizophlyctis rosea]|nr:hypothetical protein HDV00_006336 [Rhizophlyctis rosea]
MLLPSPSSSLFERSMGALVSNFKGTVGFDAWMTDASSHSDSNSLSIQTNTHLGVPSLQTPKPFSPLNALFNDSAASLLSPGGGLRSDLLIPTQVNTPSFPSEVQTDIPAELRNPAFDYIVGSFLDNIESMTPSGGFAMGFGDVTVGGGGGEKTGGGGLRAGAGAGKAVEYSDDMLLLNFDDVASNLASKTEQFGSGGLGGGNGGVGMGVLGLSTGNNGGFITGGKSSGMHQRGMSGGGIAQLNNYRQPGQMQQTVMPSDLHSNHSRSSSYSHHSTHSHPSHAQRLAQRHTRSPSEMSVEYSSPHMSQGAPQHMHQHQMNRNYTFPAQLPTPRGSPAGAATAGGQQGYANNGGLPLSLPTRLLNDVPQYPTHSHSHSHRMNTHPQPHHPHHPRMQPHHHPHQQHHPYRPSALHGRSTSFDSGTPMLHSHPPGAVACSAVGCGRIFANFAELRQHSDSAHGGLVGGIGVRRGSVASVGSSGGGGNGMGGGVGGGEGGEKSKPFRCELCPQTFSRSHDLKRHYYIHTQEKPFQCPRCRKGFSRRDALKRHERSVAEGKKVHCVTDGVGGWGGGGVGAGGGGDDEEMSGSE